MATCIWTCYIGFIKSWMYLELFTILLLTINQADITVADTPHSNEEFLCSHYPPTDREVIYDVDLDHGDSHHIRKRSVFENLRIHLYYDYSINYLPTSHQRLIKDLVSQAISYWERTLMVQPTILPVRLNRQCSSIDVRYKDKTRFCVDGCSTYTKCGDISIPEDHLERCYYWNSISNEYRSSMMSGPGVANKDFVLYVAALTTPRCGKSRTIAYAAHCQQERLLDRPVAGYFTICPETISTKPQDHTQLLSTMKHEILHALGFTAGLYAFYRDELGNPLTPRFPESNKPPYNPNLHLYQWSQKVVKSVVRKYWKVAKGFVQHRVNLIVTPRVVREARKHFNCPTLEGAELEDQGLIGTHLTHWEKRIFENEAMTGTYTQNPVISRITLALMEDTGWYKANYMNAEHLEWGEGLGCDFVKRSCLDWIDTQRAKNGDIHPFCDTVRQGVLRTDCTQNRNSVAFCNLQEYTAPLRIDNQYFSYLPGIDSSRVNRYGGSVSLADYCPFLQEFTWRDAQERTVRDSRCLMHENNPMPQVNYYGESYGQGSKCFNHYGSWRIQRCNKVFPLYHSGSGCYNYDCDRNQGLLISVNYRSYQCLKSGQKLHIGFIANSLLHKGYIICPSCREVCNIGFVCPPEREPYNIVHDVPVHVPCSTTNIHSVKWNLILSIVLCYFCVSMCQS